MQEEDLEEFRRAFEDAMQEYGSQEGEGEAEGEGEGMQGDGEGNDRNYHYMLMAMANQMLSEKLEREQMEAAIKMSLN